MNKSIELIKSNLNIFKYNIKILLDLNIIISIIFAASAPLVFSFRFLDYIQTAKITEYYISIIGIILIPSIVNIENNDNIRETVCSKKTSHSKIIAFRIAFMMLIIFLIILCILLLARFYGSKFNICEIAIGTWISASFLGMIGLTIVSLTKNISSGYMVSFIYYAFEFFTSGKYTHGLYLFSLTSGSFQYGKYILLFFVFIMVTFNLSLVYKN